MATSVFHRLHSALYKAKALVSYLRFSTKGRETIMEISIGKSTYKYIIYGVQNNPEFRKSLFHEILYFTIWEYWN